MKFNIYIAFLLLFCSFPGFAQQDTINKKDVEYRFALGVQLGTDIGGAIPFPFSNVPKPFNPYPRLAPSIGAKLTFPVNRHWTLGTEFTYKKIAIDADARIKNQKFNDRENGVVASFTGSAEMGMDFTMMEVPVYFKYTFKNQKDRILVGAYASWIINSEFDIKVNKGYMMDEHGNYSGAIDKEPLEINFNDILDKWDAGMVVGYERRLFSRIDLGLRFSCGFKDIFKSDNQYFDYSMLHMRGTLVVSYDLIHIKPSRLNPFRQKN